MHSGNVRRKKIGLLRDSWVMVGDQVLRVAGTTQGLPQSEDSSLNPAR